jgi:hypothetical protein
MRIFFDPEAEGDAEAPGKDFSSFGGMVELIDKLSLYKLLPLMDVVRECFLF